MNHKEEIQDLQTKIQDLKVRIYGLDRRIARLRNKPRPYVNAGLCKGCGICEKHCPVGAISVDTVARIEEGRCVGCGLCANVCPKGAIHFQ